MGRYREALAYQLRFLRLPGRHFDANIDAGARNGVGEVFARLGPPDSARAYFRQALKLSRSNDDRRDEALALAGLGALEARAGHPGPATRYLTQALAMQQQLGDEPARTTTLLAAGRTGSRPRPAGALARYQQALALARRSHMRENQRVARTGLAATYARQGRFAEAYDQARQAAALRDSLLNEASIHEIVEMKTRYETERKEARNQLQASQLRVQQQVIRRRSVQLGAGLAIAALLVGLGYLIINRRQLRREVEFGQEREQLERQRAQAVLEAEEAERRRIGADLHDGVGQLLSVVKLNLSALGEELHARLRPDEQLRFADALTVVDESVHELRDISHDLLPNALLKQGLARAVRAFLDKVSRPGRLRINLETLGLAKAHLPSGVEYALYRVVQEAVQNIVKHAHASEINLQLISHADELTLLIEDNGVVFDPAVLVPAAGVGLLHMSSRLAYLGGELTVDSRPGHGTTITAHLPFTPPEWPVASRV